MDELRSQLEAWRTRLDALSLRERALILAALLAVVLATWNALLQGHLAEEGQRLQAELSQVDLRAQMLKSAADEVLARSKLDPNRSVRERQVRLNAELEQLRARQAQLARTFLPPATTAMLLQDVLRARTSLRLIAVNSMPPEPLMASDLKAAEKPGEGEAQPMIYRHDLVLEFEGAFFDMLDYLKVLEVQPLYWDSIDYRVSAYPLAKVRLRVYTLSFEKEWLGV
jgi:MSHA biogenesis protein MshJ